MADNPTGNLIVFRAPSRTSQAQVQHLLDGAEYITAKLKHGDAAVVFLDGIAAYYLRPGDSTEEMDAHAEALRLSLKPTGRLQPLPPDPGPPPDGIGLPETNTPAPWERLARWWRRRHKATERTAPAVPEHDPATTSKHDKGAA